MARTAEDIPSGTTDERVGLPNGLAVHLRCHGAVDAPPLVFLHGVMNAAVSYDALCRGLARHRRVIAMDQRGHGETDHADDYGWERWVEDIALVVDTLELGAVDLVGHSMGAKHAARFAALHPGAVRRLALLEAGFGEINSPEAPDYWARIGKLFPPDGFATPDDYVQLAVKLFPRADPAVVAEATAYFLQGNDGRWSWPLQADVEDLARTRTEPTPDVEQELRRSVRCPTLVARAEFSEVFVGDDYQKVAAEYAQGHHQLLHGTGHMLMWEAVDITVAVLDDFLA